MMIVGQKACLDKQSAKDALPFIHALYRICEAVLDGPPETMKPRFGVQHHKVHRSRCWCPVMVLLAGEP